MRLITRTCACVALAALTALGAMAEDLTYTNGVFFINEDQYGLNLGSVNYYNYDYSEMEYGVFTTANPKANLGVTPQHAQMYGGRLYIMSKQASYSSATNSGGRLCVLDGTTLKLQGTIVSFGSADSTYDGRSYCAVNNDKGYVATSAGIFVLDVATMTTTGPIAGSESVAKGDYTNLYSGQSGDMVRVGGYVYAVKQGEGLLVIDVTTDAVVKVIPFPNIVTVFVTAGGHMYVANNSREIYDYGSGPFEADFTEINMATLEAGKVHKLDDTKGAESSWGAWRARMVCPDPKQEVVYYNYDEYQNYISSYNFATGEFIDTLILLPEGVDKTWKGEVERQAVYASAISFDPHTGRMVVQTTEAAPKYAYQTFNRNWVLFYDMDSLKLVNSVRLRDAYWFPAMAVYPDLYGPEIHTGDTTVACGGELDIDLLQAVTDADNMSSLIITSATSADASIVEAVVDGYVLRLTGKTVGQTTVTIEANSNGKTTSRTITVTVTRAKGDVNMDGVVNISDVTALIDAVLNGSDAGIDRDAADMNGDGLLTISDVTALIDLVLSK